jgi:DNA-binding Xre family transcriptional regulator
MQTVTSRLDELLGLKGVRERRRISYRTVARETGIPLHTIIGIANNTVAMYPEDALVALCAYVPCTPGELLSVTDVPDEALPLIRRSARERRNQRSLVKA